MTSAVNNYQYSSSINTELPSSLKKMEENPESFKLYMAQLGNVNVQKLLSSAVYSDDNNSESTDSGYSYLNSLGATDGTSLGSVGSTSFDPFSFLTSSSSSVSDFSSLLGTSTPSLDSYKVSETLAALQEYSNVSETKRWLGQMVSYVDPDDKNIKTGIVSKVIIENVEKPIFIVDDKELSLADLVSIETNTTGV